MVLNCWEVTGPFEKLTKATDPFPGNVQGHENPQNPVSNAQRAAGGVVHRAPGTCSQYIQVLEGGLSSRLCKTGSHL